MSTQTTTEKNNYIFLTEQFAEETVYYAISPERIQKIKVCEVYGNFGQQTTHEDAGDNLVVNTQQAADKANAAEDSKGGYEVGSCITAYDDNAAFSALLGEEGVTMYQDECKGLTYWDGHNWKTITVEMPYSEPAYEIVSDPELIAELNAAIIEKEFVREGFGTKIYNANGWVVEDNYCEGSWEAYRLYKDESESESE